MYWKYVWSQKDIWVTERTGKKERERQVSQKRERQTEGEIGIVYHQRSFARQW